MPITTDFPIPGYLANAGRTQAEMKDALESFLAASREAPGMGGAWSTLTVAAGAIAPTLGEHLVDTEAAAAADDLTNIGQTTLEDGRLLILRGASATRVVAVKHAAGGVGQVSIADAADLLLTDPSMFLILRRNGTQWDEVERSWGNQKAAFRTRYDVPSLGATPNRYLFRQEWNYGADLASATTLTLGTGGNAFRVTGAVPITGINAVARGARILLEIAATAALIYHATNLILQNGVDFQGAPGDVLELLSLGGGAWKEINRHLTTQSLGFWGPPESTVIMWEDFLGDVTAWTPAEGSLTNLGTARGIVRILSTGGPMSFAAGTAQRTEMNPVLSLRVAQAISVAATYRIGWMSSASGDPAHGIYLRHSNGGTLIAVCRSANVETAVDTGILAAVGVFRKIQFVVTGATKVEVNIDGVLRATITTNIPTGDLIASGSANGGNAGFDLDYVVARATR